MEHVEAVHDLARQADEAMELVRSLLDRIAEMPIRFSHGRSVAGDLVRAGWPESAAGEQAIQLIDQIEQTRAKAGATKTEIEFLTATASDMLNDTAGVRLF